MKNTSKKSFFTQIFQSELAGGAVLFAAALLAVATANSSDFAGLYERFLNAPVGIILGGHQLSFSAAHFINDGLMAVFFLMVGLEIKREFVEGELSSRSQALLPAIAALGGMIVPALIYTAFNYDDATAMRGWAVPTATDIAFSLGVLSLLGSRVPLSLKIFLTAVAVIDDLGAIAIIAFFYTQNLNTPFLMLALFVILYLFVLNKNNIHIRLPYAIGFILLWTCLLQSGVHATLAGVATALAVPARRKTPDEDPLLVKLEHDLYYVVTFIILPVFAFANAGVKLQGITLSSLAAPIPLGILLGLFIGKIIGIGGAVFLCVKTGISSLPKNCSWSALISVACLCGIGFTVSLFIGNLGFQDPAIINQVKIGVLCGSILAGVTGLLLLRFVAFRAPNPPPPAVPSERFSV